MSARVSCLFEFPSDKAVRAPAASFTCFLECSALVIRPFVQDPLPAFSADANLPTALDDSFLILVFECGLNGVESPRANFPAVRTSQESTVQPCGVKHQRGDGCYDCECQSHCQTRMRTATALPSAMNPKGIPSFSPGLARTRLPWVNAPGPDNPERVASRRRSHRQQFDATPLGLEILFVVAHPG